MNEHTLEANSIYYFVIIIPSKIICSNGDILRIANILERVTNTPFYYIVSFYYGKLTFRAKKKIMKVKYLQNKLTLR